MVIFGDTESLVIQTLVGMGTQVLKMNKSGNYHKKNFLTAFSHQRLFLCDVTKIVYYPGPLDSI